MLPRPASLAPIMPTAAKQKPKRPHNATKRCKPGIKGPDQRNATIAIKGSKTNATSTQSAIGHISKCQVEHLKLSMIHPGAVSF